jgi:hypothetical protein
MTPDETKIIGVISELLPKLHKMGCLNIQQQGTSIRFVLNGMVYDLRLKKVAGKEGGL